MPNLYEINFALDTIMRRAEDNGGEISEQDAAELAALELARPEKITAYAHVAARALAEATGLKAQIEAYTAPLLAKAKAKENLVERLKAVVFEDMKNRGDKKIGDTERGWRIQNGPKKVEIVDEKAIPASFWHQPPPELSKSEIADLLKAGGEVPGAKLVQTEHIRLT